MNYRNPAWCAAWASLLGMLIAPPLTAGEPGRAAVERGDRVVDVALDTQQHLHGQVVSPSGEPAANEKLTVLQQGERIAQFATDAEGRFVGPLPRGGVYQLIIGSQLTSIRAWTTQAAPPGCAQQVVVVRGEVVRGQGGQIPYTQVNPWLVAGVVAVAVAIPVVLANHRSDRGDGS